jgi:hypothetical protein
MCDNEKFLVHTFMLVQNTEVSLSKLTIKADSLYYCKLRTEVVTELNFITA